MTSKGASYLSMTRPVSSKKFMFDVARDPSSLNFFSSPPSAASASSKSSPLATVTVNDTRVSVWFSLKSLTQALVLSSPLSWTSSHCL